MDPDDAPISASAHARPAATEQSTTAAVSIAQPRSDPPKLNYSVSLNERNTFYFQRSTAGPSSGPSDPNMMPTLLELPPPSLETSSIGSSPPRFSHLSASAPATTTVNSWRDSYRTMKPSKEDAEPAKISHDGTPTIFSFLTQPPERGEDDKAGGAADALHAPFESFTINSQQRQESDRADDRGRCSESGRDDGEVEADDMFELDLQ